METPHNEIGRMYSIVEQMDAHNGEPDGVVLGSA